MMLKGVNEKISLCRSSIMGVAILWVLLYHFGFDMPVVSPICENGFLGVDLFMFLSGFGLYFSMKKGTGIFLFYVRRLLRIIPLYIIFGIIVSFIIQSDSICAFLYKVSTLGFWIEGDLLSYEWYTPSLLILYLVFPALFYMVEKPRGLWGIFVFLVFFLGLSVICIVIGDFVDFPWFLLLYRVPIFVFGILVAKATVEKVELPWLILALSGLCVAILIEIFAGPDNLKLYYFGRTFASPVLVLIMVFIFSRCQILNSFFGYIGGMTYEIYLSHMILLKAGFSLSGIPDVAGTIVKMLMSLCMAAVTHYLVIVPINKIVLRGKIKTS